MQEPYNLYCVLGGTILRLSGSLGRRQHVLCRRGLGMEPEY